MTDLGLGGDKAGKHNFYVHILMLIIMYNNLLDSQICYTFNYTYNNNREKKFKNLST